MFSKHSQKTQPNPTLEEAFGILLDMLGIGKQMLESIDRQ